MIITKTPLRVSLIGGGTDLKSFYSKHQGSVLSFTIDKYIYVILNKRSDDKIVLNYTTHEMVEETKDIRHDYIKVALELFDIKSGVEIHTMADISGIGSGLGSSSALSVGLVKALSELKELKMTKGDILNVAITLEISKLGQPIGIQDHCSASFGGFNNFVFCKGGRLLVEPLILSHETIAELEDHLMLFNLGRKKQTAKQILEKQNELTVDQICCLQDLVLMVDEMRFAIETKNYYDIAAILDRGWELKKRINKEVTTIEIDKTIEKLKQLGVLGAKVCGSGGGGHLICVIELGKRHLLQEKSGLQEIEFRISEVGTERIL